MKEKRNIVQKTKHITKYSNLFYTKLTKNMHPTTRLIDPTDVF